MKAYPTYKDSGVQWLSEVPDTWNVFPAKQLFADSKERRRKDDTFLTASQKYGVISQLRYMQLIGGRIVQASQDFDKWKHVEPDDFVISLRSFQGGLEMCTERGCVTWHYVVLKPKMEIIPLYFKWLFKSFSYIKSLQSTCNFIRDGQDLRYSNFVQVPIPFPPLTEQKTIASFLDKKCAEIEELISRRQSIIERLRELKQSIIAEAVTKGLNPDVPMKESGIDWMREIPVHWTISKIKNKAKVSPRVDISHINFGDLITFTPMEYVKQGYFIPNNMPYEAKYNSYTPYAEGDIIIAKVTPCFENGNICIMNNLSSHVGFGSSELIVIRPNNILPAFLMYALRNPHFIAEGKKTMYGTGGLKRISPRFIPNCNIAVPPEKEQHTIVAYLDKKCAEIDELVARQEKIIEKLKELKTSTIAHVVTGKVDVRGAI